MFASTLIAHSLLPLRAQAPDASGVVYRTARSILSLPHEVAEHGGGAFVRGTITFSASGGFVVHDSTGSVWVDYDNRKLRCGAGDVVSVLGQVSPGRYSPIVSGSKVTVVGHGPLPVPKPVSLLPLTSGLEDVQYVSMEGTVRAVGLRDDLSDLLGGTLLVLGVPNGRVEVFLPSQYKETARTLVGSTVRVSATAIVRKNDNMQATGVVLAVSSLAQIKVLRPGPKDPFDAKAAVPIDNLMRYRSGTDYDHQVTIKGVVTYDEPGVRLIVQDSTQAIEIFPIDSPPLQLGDQVEALGYIAPDPMGPILRDVELRLLAHGRPLSATPIDWETITASRFRFGLVSTDLRVLQVINEPSRTLFLLQHGNQVTTAELDRPVATMPRFLNPGSTVHITGINLISGEAGLNYIGGTIVSHLLLRSLDDLSLVSPAPWWNKTRLVYLVALLSFLILALFALYLYSHLRRWKVETILHEREKLAHDIHDTLAQSFAGIGFQIQVIRRAILNSDPEVIHHVDIARELVRFSHTEARKSLAPPSKDDESINLDLVASLDACARGLITNGLIAIDVSSSGPSRPLPAKLQRHLFRIGQEAISNAVHHADPTSITIAVEYLADYLRLTISDNGRGFALRGDLLGFGIRGMRKRASEIGGNAEILSAPGSGTSVSVQVPLPRRMWFPKIHLPRSGA